MVKAMLDNELQNTYACPAVGTHYATVCVPVTVKPFGIPGPVTVECYGKPEITGEDHCHGNVGTVCHFTISQRVRIDVPVDFGASVCVGETLVDCDYFSVEPCAKPVPVPVYAPNAPGPVPPNPGYQSPNAPNAPDNDCGCGKY
jgi:hypothetical protein